MSGHGFLVIKTLQEERYSDSIFHPIMSMQESTTSIVTVRYVVDDVDAAIDFYTDHFGFEVQIIRHLDLQGWNATVFGCC